MKNIFLKQGVFREGETEKSYGKEFNLKSWFKQALSYFNVPHADDCCTPTTNVPTRYDLNTSKIQAYDTVTQQWFNLPAAAVIARSTFKGNIEIWGGNIVASKVVENSLSSGCSGSISNPTYSVTGNELEAFFPNNCNPDPFTDAHMLVNFDQTSGPTVAYIKPQIVDPTSTIGFTLYDSAGNTINYSAVTIKLYIQISTPAL